VSETPPRPRPAPNNECDAAFWSFVNNSELRVQRCAACSTWRHPPASSCARCGASEYTWEPVSGRGEVWTFTVIHPPTLPAFASQGPYGAVVVRLDEGVFMVSNLVDCPVEELAVGERVEVVLAKVEDDLTLPQFRRC
jgi:uncharacterized OB-fold protein